MLGNSCAPARPAMVYERLSRVEENHSEISSRLDMLTERLHQVLMPVQPCEDAKHPQETIRPVVPPLCERLECLEDYQKSTIARLSDILERLEI